MKNPVLYRYFPGSEPFLNALEQQKKLPIFDAVYVYNDWPYYGDFLA